MKSIYHRIIDFSLRTGFFSLGATLFLMSFPRSFSLYTMVIFLLTGLVLWVLDFNDNRNFFLRKWYLAIPPILYFFVHLSSLILQGGNIKLLETRLMFLLIPALGLPFFRYEYFSSRISVLLKVFVAGLSVVIVFLLIRIMVVMIFQTPADLSFSEYFKQNNQNLVSWGFSILEHPSYLSMKVIFAFILLMQFSAEWKIKGIGKWSLFLIFSITIFMLASKAGIIACLIFGLILLIQNLKTKSTRRRISLIIIPIFLVLIYISVKHLERISYFIVYTGRGLDQKEFEWKNLDQRTKEWYTSIELIKEKPLTGFGIAKTESKMVEMYLKNGFKEEADLLMNSHNQYLEAQATFGVFGTISLIWMLITPVIFRRKVRYRIIAVPFILIISYFLIFESMFNRQWGIMFFLFFYYLIILSPDDQILKS